MRTPPGGFRREDLIGTTVEVLVDAPGEARTYREAPEIDGIVTVPTHLPVGSFVQVMVTDADGPDLTADPVDGPRGAGSPLATVGTGGPA